MTHRVAVEFEHLFKADTSEQPIAPAPHDGSRWSHAVMMDKHAHSESVERPYLQGDGNFAKLFTERRASVLFKRSRKLRQRLLSAMGESAGERDDLLAAFLSNDESAARLALRRALRADKENFPTTERFEVGEPDEGPKDGFSFDDFLEAK